MISFHDQPIIHVTFGLVEFSNLITPSAGSSGRKSISLTVVDTEFDLAWAYYCTVFGAQNLQLYTAGNNQYVTFSTYPSSSGSKCFLPFILFTCLWLYIVQSGSAPSTPAKFRKFVKRSKETTAARKVGAIIHRRRPAAISSILQGGTNKHVVGPDADSEFSFPYTFTNMTLIIATIW